MRPKSDVGAGFKPAPTTGVEPAPTASQSPRRRNLRLRNYDYTQAGFYFVTICVQNRQSLFGEIIDGIMQFNSTGTLVEQAWQDLPNHYPHVELDKFVVMPNHFHGIVVLTNPPVGACLKPAPKKRHGLPEIVRAFKTFSARHINETRQTTGVSVWQRNYYEHVIRNDADYQRIAEYIESNPAKWADDSLHPDNAPPGLRDTTNEEQDGKTSVGAGLQPDVGAGFKPAPTVAKGDADE